MTEIEILQEKIYFGIATASEKETLEVLLRQTFTDSGNKINNSEEAAAFQRYQNREQIKAAKRLQQEYPGTSITLGGIPISLWK